MLRKHIMFGLLALAIFATALIGAEARGGDKQVSLAFVIQDLSNPTWAEDAKSIEKLATKNGWKMTALDCKGNAATQISQVENLIQEGMNVLILHPADATALEAVCGEARAKGVKVISWDSIMDNADVGYIIKNYDVGMVIGQHAAKWINEKFAGKAKVAVLDYPIYPELVDRANGIIAGLRTNAPEAQIVATAAAVTATEGMSKTENILMANPDIKVIACIGDGGAIGANEAVKASGKGDDTFGIFSCDATQEALSKMANKEYIRMTISMGTYDIVAEELVGIAKKLLAGEKVDRAFVRTPTPVTSANLSTYYGK